MSRLLLALVLVLASAMFLSGCSGGGPSPQPSSGTATASTTAAEPTSTITVVGPSGTRATPELFVSQVIGMRGCEQPIFVTGGGFPPRTRVRLERVDTGRTTATATSDTGFVALDARPLFVDGCEAEVRHVLRLMEESSGRELTTSEFEVPALRGTIEVEPASGGCSEIVVTLRGMPADAEVNVFMADPAPFAHNFASIIWPPLQADSHGTARSAPFRPPWSCETAAVSLFAAAGSLEPVRVAELLYRIALQPGEPVPSVERWLASIGR